MDKFLKKYLSTNSPSGAETEAQEMWEDKMCKILPNHQLESAFFGSSYMYELGGNKPIIVIEAHVDEISWRVSQIESSGLVKVHRNGGTDETTALGSRVVLFNPLKGTSINGVFGQTAIHLRKDEKLKKVEDLYVDFGFGSKEEALEFITVGDLICYTGKPMGLRDGKITSKAIDNKIGGYILVEVAKQLNDLNLQKVSVNFLNAVQEETGLRGAKLFCNIHKFDYAIVTDVCHATDTPNINRAIAGDIKLGGGAVLTRGSLLCENLVDMIKDEGCQMLAARNSTGTDADEFAMSNGGTPTALIKTPLRYMHTQTELCDMKDVNHVISTIVALVVEIDRRQ